LAPFHVDDRLFGLGMRKRVQRNHDHRAKALRHDALRRLKIHVCLSQILGDYRLLFFQGEIYRRLARSQAFRRKTQSAATPRQAHMQRFLVIGFEKHAAVGVHNGDGVIQHHAQHFVEREL
jgi:hypothetical protein